MGTSWDEQEDRVRKQKSYVTGEEMRGSIGGCTRVSTITDVSRKTGSAKKLNVVLNCFLFFGKTEAVALLHFSR